MRVGIDASNLRHGGGVTHLVELLRAANPAAHGIERVTVWAGRRTAEQIPRQPWLDLPATSMLDGALPQRVWWQTRTLPPEAARTSDVLFVPGGTFAGRFRPFVTMFRNMLPFDPPERRRYGWSAMHAKLALLARTQAKTFRRADGVIVLTEHAREVLAREVPHRTGALAVIPHGIDAALFRAPRPQLPLTSYTRERPFRMLYVSTIDVYKHQSTVAAAVAALRREGLPVDIRFVGGSYSSAVRELERVFRREDPAGEFLHYDGEAARSTLGSVYSASDAFVFASTCENLPNILLEAMASGLPIACSNRRPMPDLLGPEGIYFDPEQLPSVTAAIRSLADDVNARRRIADAAFARACVFSWERCARETFGFIGHTLRFGALSVAAAERYA